MKRYLPILLLLCAACVMQPPEPPQTQLQIRQYQTRTFDLSDQRRILKAALNVLQDEGYIIKAADADLGLISANKEQDVSTLSPFWVGVISSGGEEPRYPQAAVIEASVNVSSYGKQTKVRINLLQRTLDNRGAIMKTGPITEAKQYQELFSRMEKAVFLEGEGL